MAISLRARRVSSLCALVGAFHLVCSTRANAFSVPIHRSISKQQLAEVSASVGSQVLTFSNRALEEVADANEDCDSILNGSAGYFHPERHFLNGRFADSSLEIRNLRQALLADLLFSEPPDGEAARKALGQALHTIQDFYSHSNWVETNHRGILELGFEVIPDPVTGVEPCPSNPNALGPNGGNGVSSGHYVGIFGCGPLTPGQCYHGNYSEECRGINKDRADLVPLGMHAEAVALARTATTVFVQELLEELAGEDDALRALLDTQPGVGFVIDDTGSMGPEIGGVKIVVNGIVHALNLLPFTRPSSWLLERFGDPDVGPPFVTQDAEVLLDAVSGLQAHGGGDCPELSQQALLEAIETSRANALLTVFTDASAKDAALVNTVIGRAQAKHIRLVYALTGSCSPIDPAYIRGARETGGQLFFVGQSEVAQLLNLITPNISSDLSTVVAVNGTLASFQRDVPIPIDSTVTRLTVAGSIDVKQGFQLVRPNGQVVSASDPDAQISNLSTGGIVVVTAPQPGQWVSRIAGNGSYSLSAQVNSSLEFNRFDFVEFAGDIHGGFAPVSGLPLLGSTALGEATLLGTATSGAFRIVDESGVTLQTLAFTQGYPDAAPDHFVGTVNLPAVPFQVVVSGLDGGGFPYQRQVPTIYRAQTLGVDVIGPRVVQARPGQSTSIPFTLTNVGAASTFQLSTSAATGVATSAASSTVTLGSGESTTVLVSATLPATATQGFQSPVTLTATRQGDLASFNSASVTVAAVTNSPPNCLPVSSLALWPANHSLSAIDVRTQAPATDPDGDPLTYTVTSIRQDEATDEQGDGATHPDAFNDGAGRIRVRSERSGTGDGRVYTVRLTVSDPSGASCSNSLQIAVPHDKGSTALNGGELFDSTQ